MPGHENGYPIFLTGSLQGLKCHKTFSSTIPNISACPHWKGAPDLGSSWWPSPEQIQQVNLLPMHDDGKEYSASHCLRSLCV